MQRKILALALFTAATPFAAAAQETPGAQPATASPEQPSAPPTAEEVAQLRQRLSTLQQRAKEDSAVEAANEAFNAEVLAAMQRLDATAAARTTRASAIQTEAAAARAAGDNARLAALAEEAKELQAFFAALRERAMALPEIEAGRQAYIAQLFAKMTELDPEAPGIVARLDQAREARSAAPPAESQTQP